VSTAKDIGRIWDIIEGADVGMLTTAYERGLRARPLQLRPDRAAGTIWFVTDARSGKINEVEAEHDVCLVVTDSDRNIYLSLTARAQSVRDLAKAAEIWRKTDDMWWDGPSDPDVRLLRVVPLVAELWDGPSTKAAAIYEMGKALLTGAEPALGENRKSTVEMR